MIYTNPVIPRWQLMAYSFPYDWQALLLQLWPDLEVDYEQIKNQPSVNDPLGAQPRLNIRYMARLDGAHEIKVSIDGDDRMPWLDPASAETFMLVEWPHLFRRRTR